MTLYVLGSLSKISRDATKPRTMIAEEEIIFFFERLKNVIPPKIH